MQPQYKRAARLALKERRLWAAGLLTALALSEAWWVLFGWGPEWLGEGWRAAVAERMGEGCGFAALIMTALAAFVVLKAVGYLGEMVLVRQVADGAGGRTPRFTGAFSHSRRRYIPFAVTLLPYDALRFAAIYLPSMIMAAWERWDPHYHHIAPYLLAVMAWLAVLVAVLVLAGITTALAARLSLLRDRGLPEAWREGWSHFMRNRTKLVVVWMQAVAADILFVMVAWPLSALLPWGAAQVAGPLGFAPARWLIYLVVYAVLAGTLAAGQTGVQCYKSSLWTTTFLEVVEGREGAAAPHAGGRIPEPPPDFMPRG